MKSNPEHFIFSPLDSEERYGSTAWAISIQTCFQHDHISSPLYCYTLLGINTAPAPIFSHTGEKQFVLILNMRGADDGALLVLFMLSSIPKQGLGSLSEVWDLWARSRMLAGVWDPSSESEIRKKDLRFLTKIRDPYLGCKIRVWDFYTGSEIHKQDLRFFTKVWDP